MSGNLSRSDEMNLAVSFKARLIINNLFMSRQRHLNLEGFSIVANATDVFVVIVSVP